MRARLVQGLALLLALGVTASGCTTTPPDPSTSWFPDPRAVGDLRVLAESDAEGFRLHTSSGDKTFLPGVNLGSTLPTLQPGEVGTIEASHYRTWLRQMGELGIRVVRVYTLLPPGFYAELKAYNEANPVQPIYLVQGAYLPDESYVEPGGTLYDAPVDEAFSAELRDLSAAVHGDLERPRRPGRAWGTYDADVSPWLASWILGVEWDPRGTRRTDRWHADAPYEPGRYFVADPEATATERWIATHMEELAALEAERGVSVPVAMVNWPTTDPLDHPTEPLLDEDLVGIDALHVLPTDAWPGGTFASFHAYPYYPDFLRDEEGLDEVTWDGEPDRYGGYLARLRDHFAPAMPLLVTEFGVPASLGSAHLGTRGRGQGGHSERDAMRHDAEMMRMMESLGLGGGFVFIWADEWFKRTWNTMEHQDPERRQLWHDPLTNEQWFGMVATDPEPLVDAAVERLAVEEGGDLPADGAYEYLYVWADASWVHVDVKLRERVPARLRVEADVVPGPERADFRVTVDTEPREALLEVRRELDPVRLDTSVEDYVPDHEQGWHPYRLLLNRAFSEPGEERAAEHQEVGRLVEGTWDPADPAYDSLATWRVDEERRTVSLRIPWSMLGFADPSARLALGEGKPAERVTVDGIDLRFDADGEVLEQTFSWPTWNRTGYTERFKAGVDVLSEAFHDLAP
ncbi:hypothetical protein [Nocardioides solisilvae]|uniref:hypothetical protein n=1 Tax=Nocardioides solisilvae TaxID=1542435 RepID=UPI0013A57AFD|nr:hypothetical protein [Nocardioides solisilvae]